MRVKPYICLSQALGLLALGAGASAASADTIYQQTNLVSDLPGTAAHLDPNLANPWGIDWGPNTPFWISNNKTGTSTLYDGAGNARPLVVTIPPPAGGTPPAAPTGVVYSGGTHFAPDSTEAHPLFLFASEDGTVTGWGGGSSAVRRIDNSPSGAVYKGLALSTNATTSLLYVTNFSAGRVDAFDANFVRTLPGSFVDPNLPAGFAPFNIENIGDKLYVTYAVKDPNSNDDLAGAGHGLVDIFTTNGTFVKRLITGDATNNPNIDSPWGIALAPASFGQFANDLLVGNFGDGTIGAYDPTTGQFLGLLRDKNGVIRIPGLWGLKFGNGGNAGDMNTLFFTAGIAGPDQIEDHGLFGSLAPVPEADSALLLAVGLGLVAALQLRRRRQH